MSPERPALSDSHAHLTAQDFADDLQGVLGRAREAGVTRILTVSAELGDFERVVALAEQPRSRDEPEVWAAVGVHPHEASGWSDEVAERLRRAAAHERVVALGETGLDYHYDRSPREEQRRAFREQLALASELGLPVVVHSREAEEDTVELLSGARPEAGVVHCFTGSADMARACTGLGMHVSFSGILTYPSAGALREVARQVPEERLLVETDSPWLSPVPRRRDWPNEPARVLHVAEVLARERGVELARVAEATSAGFGRLFLGEGP